ncbi:hypothetical protein [Leekyejoonella antrihumi]|uniref:Uncharacterized protein n=1 Tax=Leekyejoonella antrihumi TaxID=1660198 RepID=A0A563E7D5_9MICO|nr:hypothetical protein [Leekyejoonella antrihumi]TWP38335.1 hypothetical protein FGL98_03760 [Leekyejoonella antrihumi]
MTMVLRHSSGRVRWVRSTELAGPLGFALVSAIAFIVVRPPVGDLVAALARQSAAAAGVGGYWFGWYAGGASTGSYSVIVPPLSALMTAPVLAAVCAVAITPLTRWLLVGSRRPNHAVWVATVAAAGSLWSGRVPFIVGMAIGIAALAVARRNLRVLTVVLSVAMSLASPVAGAFGLLAFAAGFIWTKSNRETNALGGLSAGLTIGVLALWFGTPGAEGFDVGSAAICMALLPLMLLAHPTRPVKAAIAIAAIALPVLVVVPNGMGSNFERLFYAALPVAVVATGRARRWVTVGTVVPALAFGLFFTGADLAVASAPTAKPIYYSTLAAEMHRLPDLTNHRVEVVQDGTHTAAYAMLGVATLARGYETQADDQLDGLLNHGTAVDAPAYRQWLLDNAVAYVAATKAPVQRTAELRLVVDHTPSYLHRIWQNSRWTVYAVRGATPVVAPPGHLVRMDQDEMVVRSDGPAVIELRLHWSALLAVQELPADPAAATPATLTRDGAWTTLTVDRAGTYQLAGRWLPSR